MTLEITKGPRSLALEFVDPIDLDEPTGGNVGPQGSVNPVVKGSGGPTTVFVSFEAQTASVLEGGELVITARLNQTLDVLGVIPIVRLGSSTLDLDDYTLADEFSFPAGQTEATLTLSTTDEAGGSGVFTLLDIQLDPDSATTTGYVIATEPTFGPDTMSITVANVVVGGTPNWFFPVNQLELQPPEGSTVTYSIQLDQAAPEQHIFSVNPAGGNAVASTPSSPRDYEPFTNLQVTIPQGQSTGTFQIEYSENAIDAPTNPRLAIGAELLSGSAINNGDTSFEVEILDNEITGGNETIKLNFSSVNVTLPEGATTTVRCSLTKVATNEPAFFGSSTVIALNVTEDSDSDEDFTVDWGSNPVGSLRFPPGQSFTEFTVTAGEDTSFDTGEFIAFEIPVSVDPDVYQRGSRFRTTISSTDAVDEPTRIVVPGMVGGGRRSIQMLAAVVPPSTELPEYAFDTGAATGERVQVVGLTKNNADEWDSCYVYGRHAESESIPDVGTALELRKALATDNPPAEAGSFPAPPVLNLRAFTTGGVFLASTTGVNPTLAAENWTHPTDGRWDQVGPDLYRQTAYRMRPRVSGASELETISGQACSYADLCETRMAGDDDVVLYSGRWVNGAWANPNNHADVETFATNPYTDGEIELTALRVQSEDGWHITPGDLSPIQSVLSPTEFNLIRPRNGISNKFRTCQPFTFWFAVVRDGAGADAEVRAEGYLRERLQAWAVGTLGPTRQRIWGEAGDATIDYGRANLQYEGQSGWQAIKRLGEQRGSETNGVVADWTTGGVYPFSLNTEGRVGWMHGKMSKGGGSSGGVGIYGTSGLIPWWSYWLEMKHELHKVQCRTRIAYRDVTTNGIEMRQGRDVPWYWNLAELNGGEFKLGVGGSPAREAKNRHWHFITTDDSTGDIGFSESDADRPLSGYQLAPQDRPWAAPSNAANLTYQNEVQYQAEWDTIKFTHMPRERQAYVDGWWGRRDFVAYKAYEDRAAVITRAFSPLRRFSQPSNFDRLKHTMGGFVPTLSEYEAEFGRRGTWLVPSGGQLEQYNEAGGLRLYGWSMLYMGGFYAVADDRTRLNLQGSADAGGSGNRSWMNDYGTWMEFIATEAGIISYSTQNPSPDCYTVPFRFGDVDFCQRRGAMPAPFDGDPERTFIGDGTGVPCITQLQGVDTSGQVSYTQVLFFHQIFCTRGAEALRKRYFGSGSPFPDFLERVFRWHADEIAGASNSGASTGTGEAVMPFVCVGGIGPNPRVTKNRPPTDVVSRSQHVAGTGFWQSIGIDPGDPNATPPRDPFLGYIGFQQHNSKCGWTTVGAMRVIDPALASIAKAVYSRPNDNASQFFQFLFEQQGGGGIQDSLTNPQNGQRFRSFGEKTFLIPLAADLLNSL